MTLRPTKQYDTVITTSHVILQLPSNGAKTNSKTWANVTSVVRTLVTLVTSDLSLPLVPGPCLGIDASQLDAGLRWPSEDPTFVTVTIRGVMRTYADLK